MKLYNNWLMAGDRNTTFFHTSTIIHRRRNRVEALKNERGEWIEGTAAVQSLAVDFYSKLFATESTISEAFITGHFPPISEEVRTHHVAAYSLDETRKALMSMGPLKAPGPDGFQPFFQRTREITGYALHLFTTGVLENGVVPSDAAKHC